MSVRLERCEIKAVDLKGKGPGEYVLTFGVRYEKGNHAALSDLQERLNNMSGTEIVLVLGTYQVEMDFSTRAVEPGEALDPIGMQDVTRLGMIENMPTQSWSDPVRLDLIDIFCKFAGYSVLDQAAQGYGPHILLLYRETTTVSVDLTTIFSEVPPSWSDFLDALGRQYCMATAEAEAREAAQGGQRTLDEAAAGGAAAEPETMEEDAVVAAEETKRNGFYRCPRCGVEWHISAWEEDAPFRCNCSQLLASPSANEAESE